MYDLVNDDEPSSPQADDNPGQIPADEPSTPSTPTGDEGDSSGTGFPFRLI